MGITNSNKELSAARIDSGGSFRVRLSLTAEPDVVTKPTDIVLILDRWRQHEPCGRLWSELLAMPSTNARVMVMFNDGKTTAGPDPNPIAAAAGTAEVIIYSVGLPESSGVDTAALENYTVSSCFRITSVFMPTKGKTSLLDANTVQRQIDELGVPQSEGAML